jgi:hypothetical protein
MLDHCIHLFALAVPPPQPPPDPGLTSSWLCPWLCSAGGPSEPFSNLPIGIADSFRLLCFLLGLVCLSLLPLGIAHAATRDHRMRFYALGAFILVAVTTEAVHMGDTASYRLVLNTLGCLATTYGLVKFDARLAKAAKNIGRHNK